MPKKIVIIGAAGYVGIELVTQLQSSSEYELFAYTRENGSFLLEGKKVNLLKDDDIAQYSPFDFVVNLAYPTVSDPTFFPSINQSILKTMKKLVGPGTEIIHVSTQAVFGFGMDKPIVTEFLKKRRDFPYVEAKLDMELMVKDSFPANNLSIIRLGNVWGPGAGTWTGAIAEKLVFGQFVAVDGEDGFANITDVKNVASYLVHLIETKPKGTHIFHLAEFSSIKWSQIIGLMAKELNVEPVYTLLNPYYSISLKTELKKLVKIPSKGDIFRQLVRDRYAGSYMRDLVRFLGSKRYQKLQKNEGKPLPITDTHNHHEVTHLIVTSSPAEFKTVTLNDWTPPVDFAESWRLVKAWMTEVGYISEQQS